MKVKVTWDTNGMSIEELGLPEVVDMPTMNEDEIADYLSDMYDYCIDNIMRTDIIDLDSGCYNGENAWVLEDNGSEMTLLIGDYTLDVALKAKEKYDNEQSEEYDDCIVWSDAEEWLKQQGFKK